MDVMEAGIPKLVGMWAMQTLVDGVWQIVKIPDSPGLANPPIYQWDYKEDAKRELERLFPHLPPEEKRVCRV